MEQVLGYVRLARRKSLAERIIDDINKNKNKIENEINIDENKFEKSYFVNKHRIMKFLKYKSLNI